MEVARLALDFVKAFLTPAPLAAGIVLFLLVKYREAIGNFFRLLAAQAEFRRKIDTGSRMSYLGGQFVRVGELYNKLCEEKTLTREQCDAWRTFSEHFKIAYGQAAALWKDVAETSGRGIHEQASAAVLALGKALSDFEATALHHLVNVAGPTPPPRP